MVPALFLQVPALAAALAKAQGAFGPIVRSKTARVQPRNGGAAYTYRYASLEDVIGATRPALSANGIACFTPSSTEGAEVVVCTVLLHESGQSITFPEIRIHAPGGAQETGKALTYARRYSLSAALGVAAEDDDDGSGLDGEGRKSKARKGAQDAPTNGAHGEPERISADQRERLLNAFKAAGFSKDDVKRTVEAFGFASTRVITVAKLPEVLKAIEDGALPTGGQQ